MRSGSVARSIIPPFRGSDSSSNLDRSILYLLKITRKINETKLKKMEEKRPNALEMAKKKNEERKKEETS